MSAKLKEAPPGKKTFTAEVVSLHPENRVHPDLWKVRRQALMSQDLVTIGVWMHMQGGVGLDTWSADDMLALMNDEPRFMRMLSKARSWSYATNVKAKAPNVVQLFEHESEIEREQRLYRERSKAQRVAKKAQKKSPQGIS